MLNARRRMLRARPPEVEPPLVAPITLYSAGNSIAGATASPGAHLAGHLVMVLANHSTSNVIPDLPAGFDSYGTAQPAVGAERLRLGGRLAPSDNSSGGTWTGASRTTAWAFAAAGSVTDFASSESSVSGPSGTVAIPDIATIVDDAVVVFGYHQLITTTPTAGLPAGAEEVYQSTGNSRSRIWWVPAASLGASFSGPDITVSISASSTRCVTWACQVRVPT
jgi:hypothetical protein